MYYWNYNKDEEVWYNSEETIEECIKEAKECNDGDYGVVYIATSSDFVPRIDADYFIEMIEEQAYEECGECSESWFDGVEKPLIDDLSEKLNNTFSAWLTNNGLQPTFGKFDDIRCCDIETGEEIDDEMTDDYMRTGY